MFAGVLTGYHLTAVMSEAEGEVRWQRNQVTSDELQVTRNARSISTPSFMFLYARDNNYTAVELSEKHFS